jgi:hypothetical protein
VKKEREGRYRIRDKLCKVGEEIKKQKERKDGINGSKEREKNKSKERME